MMADWLLVFASTEREWASRIAEHLQGSAAFSALPAELPAPEAQGILFLLSEAFLEEPVQRCNTLEQVLMRANNPDIALYAILLGNCDWEDSLYAGLPVLPPQRVPLELARRWSGGEDAALATIAMAIRRPPVVKKRNYLQLAWAMLPAAKRRRIRGVVVAALLLGMLLLLLYALT